MLVKYTYPIVGDIFMPEHWPISWDRYRVTWVVKEGRPESVTVAVRTHEVSGLPRIEGSTRPGFAADIRLGQQPYQADVESILRTACGLLGFFAQADIDFSRPAISWEAETPEEKSQVQMLSFSVEPREQEESPPISFDLVARCFLSATAASDKEVLLRFMAKGRRDMLAGRYIDAYYSHYFFLETQFAAGYSKSKVVAAKFKAAPEIIGAMNKARRMAGAEQQHVHQMNELLKLSDENLIEHLVETRGKLHHHAMRRQEGSWHPDKHEEFQTVSLFLSFLANEVSQRQNYPILFDDAINEQIREAATREGVAYTYVVEAEGGSDLPALRITLPTPGASHRGLAALEEELRREGAPYDRKVIRSYIIRSSDGSQVLACYRNHIFK